MKIKITIVLLSLLFILILSGIIGGCSSQILPPHLNDKQKETISTASMKVVMAVERYKYAIYSDSLIMALRKTNLFSEVNYLDLLSTSPVLTAKVTRPVHGSAIIPIFSILTLGIIPSHTEEEYGYDFDIGVQDSASESINIDCTFKGTTYIGWIAGFLNILENRTRNNPEKSSRYYSQLTYKIAAKNNLIQNLISITRNDNL